MPVITLGTTIGKIQRLFLTVLKKPFVAIVLASVLWVCAWAMWTKAGTDYAGMKAYIDGIAPDGDVETYTSDFHARVQRNMRWTAWVLAALGAMVLPIRMAFSSRQHRKATTPSSFKNDLLAAYSKYDKRTSKTHKRMVLLVILAGAVLRAILMFEPITYDEAFTYTYYATRPIWVIMSDYSYPNNHIFHTLLVKLSTGIFGIDLIPLRLPAFVAGVITMPLMYMFTRAMFNRYIAFTALCMVAAMGGLVEYSALARGYSITWACFLACLLLGRHFAKDNTAWSAVMMGVVAAIGMWTVPTMIYSAVAVYIWLFLYLLFKYESTLRQRIRMSLFSLAIAFFLTLALYSPVVIVHDIGQLFHHPTMGEATWESFMASHQDRVADVWGYMTHTASSWFLMVLFIGMLYSTFISSKYRVLLASVVLSAIPIVLLQSVIAPPRAWNYIQFVVIIGASIALFYLLKLMQDKIFGKLDKRSRTLVTGILLLTSIGYLSYQTVPDRLGRMGDATNAARLLRSSVGPQDRVVVAYPWEAPLEFDLMSFGVDRDVLYRTPSPQGMVYVAVGPTEGQHLDDVLMKHSMRSNDISEMERIAKWDKLELYRGRIDR